jgi:aryl-alcohol dehydrogenase-like predicted oxidoreductase
MSNAPISKPVTGEAAAAYMGLTWGLHGAYMGLTWRNDAESIATIHAALEADITMLDTGNFYGAR